MAYQRGCLQTDMCRSVGKSWAAIPARALLRAGLSFSTRLMPSRWDHELKFQGLCALMAVLIEYCDRLLLS